MSRAQQTSTDQQNSGGAVAPFVAGKNKIINGGMDIWQRGTSFTASGSNTYTIDRWTTAGPGSPTVSQSTNVPAGIGVRYSANATTTAGSSYVNFIHFFEQGEIIGLRGKQVVVSWYVQVNSTYTGNFALTNVYYSNSTDASTSQTTSVSISNYGPNGNTATTSWNRFYACFTVPSDAVGLALAFNNTSVQSSGATFYLTGVQMEVGSVPTPFSRAGGTLQGELALCQRYYWRATSVGSSSGYQHFGMGQAYSSSAAKVPIFLPVSMRTAPSISFTGNLGLLNSNNTAVNNASAVTADGVNANIAGTYWTGSSGLSAGNATTLMANANNTCYIEFSSEL
jgi:hypothetical protein